MPIIQRVHDLGKHLGPRDRHRALKRVSTYYRTQYKRAKAIARFSHK